MDLSIQVKLLRVIETRKFSAVGDTAVREFLGKLIAATNRDLHSEIREGRFREDLYYRLCADLVHTPSLSEQIDDSPGVLDDLLLFMVRRAVGDEAESCLPEVKSWLGANLARRLCWPGNYRELEQCVRNVIIRRSYQPIVKDKPAPEDSFFERYRNGDLTMDEVVRNYSALVYRKTGSYEDAARRLGVDRRTRQSQSRRSLLNVQPGGIFQFWSLYPTRGIMKDSMRKAVLTVASGVFALGLFYAAGTRKFRRHRRQPADARQRQNGQVRDHRRRRQHRQQR